MLHQWTYDQIAFHQFVLLGVPAIIRVVRWGTYATDFRDTWLHVGDQHNGLSRALIGEVSATFKSAFS